MRSKKIVNKRTARKLSKSWLGILILIILAGYYFYQEYKPIEPGERFLVTLKKCVDGDTAWFYIDEKEVKVRFLYIDTPESTKEIEPYGVAASEFVADKLESAKQIELELNVDGNQYDKYDRLLAWIFVDGELLQEEIARNGYCKGFYDYDYQYTYKKQILKAHEDAKKNHRGIYQ